jgi:putative phosphoesterase
MTRIAFISDLHADVHALRDALASIERLGCQQVICAGDLVDHGVFPEETLRLLIERRIPCIRGNHDRWATRGDQLVRDWDVSAEAMKFLRELPASWSGRIDGVRVVVWHARPGSDMAGIYPDISEEDAAAMLETSACDVLVVGHTHLAFARRVTGGRMIVNPGALLRDPANPMETAMLLDPESGRFVPGPAPGGGTFGVLDLPRGKFTIHRVDRSPL